MQGLDHPGPWGPRSESKLSRKPLPCFRQALRMGCRVVGWEQVDHLGGQMNRGGGQPGAEVVVTGEGEGGRFNDWMVAYGV